MYNIGIDADGLKRESLHTMKNIPSLILCTLMLLSFALLFTACGKDKTDSLAPGLYDKDGDLISSWDNLTSEYGFNVETDYTYDTHPDSPSCILADNADLAGGVTLVIGNVNKIGDMSFKFCETLTTVVIPDSVTSIGAEAFWFCSSLKTVKLGKSLTSIGDSAFTACTSLEGISIPNTVTHIGTGAFQRCTALESITLPDSLKTVYPNLFSSCESLKSVKLGKNLESICFHAFLGTALTSITIPKSVTVIEDESFMGCSDLVSITFEGSTSEWNSLVTDDLASSVAATEVKCSDGTVPLN